MPAAVLAMMQGKEISNVHILQHLQSDRQDGASSELFLKLKPIDSILFRPN